MRKWSTGILGTLVIALSFLVGFQGTQAKDFSDVQPERAEYLAIQYLSQENIFRGQNDSNRFDPEGLLNRAEWPTLMVRFKGVNLPSGDYGLCFPDVTLEWFASAVCYAKDHGWVKGYSAGPEAGSYGPGNRLTLAEVLVMLARLFDWGIQEGGEWYEGPYQYALNANIISGGEALDAQVTRAEAAELLFRAIAIEEYNVSRYDPVIATLLLPGVDSGNENTPPPEDLPQVTIRGFAIQPEESSVASGATYIPVLRFQIEADKPVTVDQISIQRTSLGVTKEIEHARLMVNGRLIKEGPFTGEDNHVVWRNLGLELNPDEIYLAEMNIDFIKGARPDFYYQFRLDPEKVLFARAVDVTGETVEGEVFKVVQIPAESVTISNPSKALKRPFVESDNQVIGRFDITAGAHDLLIKRIKLEDNGDLNNKDFTNVRLTVGSQEVASLESFEKDELDFIVREYFIEAGRTRTFTVRADIGDVRINDNLRIYMDEPQHLHAFDFEFGYGVRVENDFNRDVAWCVGSESTLCPDEGLRKRCSKDDIENEVRDCEEEEEDTVPESCDERLAPVCGLSPDEGKKTYTNRCQAEQDLATSILPGPCPESGFVCTADYDPVCAELNGVPKTYSNSCYANLAGANNLSSGVCEDDGDFCTTEYDPVCAEKNGIQKTYSNSCNARQENATVVAEGECGTVCPAVVAPVCGDIDGIKKTFDNRCLAEQEQAENILPGPC